MLVAAAALAPSHGPAPKGGLRAKAGGPRPAGLALEQNPDDKTVHGKEMTKDPFGTEFKSQNGLCQYYLYPIIAGIVAGILKIVTKAEGCLYMLFDAVSTVGSIMALFTLFFVFGGWSNGTRLWDQYDNDKSYGGLSPACFWVVVLAVWQVAQCACICCCVVPVAAGAAMIDK